MHVHFDLRVDGGTLLIGCATGPNSPTRSRRRSGNLQREDPILRFPSSNRHPQMVGRDEPQATDREPSAAYPSRLRDGGSSNRDPDFEQSESSTSRHLRSQETATEEPNTTERVNQRSALGRFISISIDRQPPLEIRSDDSLPPIIVRVRSSRKQQDNEDVLGGNSSIFAQASLMSADGQTAMAVVVPDILSGSNMVTPLSREPPGNEDEENWSLNFTGLRIHRSGYYKIHIALIGSERGGSSNLIVGPPRELMGVDTQVIRVHAFAPT